MPKTFNIAKTSEEGFSSMPDLTHAINFCQFITSNWPDVSDHVQNIKYSYKILGSVIPLLSANVANVKVCSAPATDVSSQE